ncbi:hypothetical protein C7S20_14370 [Christiangramia fulva]|uniref:DUF4175 domain-containing protein n=1 Tax=Christiangramia fulva TaxID=2126553 RepID=A0A2R3Z7X8_9FLAO|nr:hypothetical protein [Christiangramia fulva]AVR46355.1 hypothetical protein C7S20_14370 [Christiangramia fulva]
MKVKILVVTFAGLLIFISCNQNKTVNSILENEETRNEIFGSIIDNPEYMSDFRNYMLEHNSGSNMMMGGSMGGMNHSENMMNMQDSTAMMQSFMNRPGMMANMIEMMHTRGMMSDECMTKAMSAMNNMPEKQ